MIPPLPSETDPCYYFTNNSTIITQLKKTKWIGVFIDKQTDDDVIESNMIGKHIKALPHEYEELKKYDYLCYFDSKISRVNKKFVEKCISTHFINGNKAFLLRKNPKNAKRGSVMFELSHHQGKKGRKGYKMQDAQYRTYIQNQVDNGLLLIHLPGFSCGFSIRNMKHPSIINLNTTWYEHIQQCGIQDQISFHFVKQLFPGIILGLPSDWNKLQA